MGRERERGKVRAAVTLHAEKAPRKGRSVLLSRLMDTADELLWGKHSEDYGDYHLARNRHSAHPAVAYIVHGYGYFPFPLQKGQRFARYDIAKRTQYAGGSVFHEAICKIDGEWNTASLVEDFYFTDSEEAPDELSPSEIEVLRKTYNIPIPKLTPQFIGRLMEELSVSIPY